MKKPLISIGFDKNGEADFEILLSIQDLSLEKMQELRAIIPVAISQAEQAWQRYQPQVASLDVASIKIKD